MRQCRASRAALTVKPEIVVETLAEAQRICRLSRTGVSLAKATVDAARRVAARYRMMPGPILRDIMLAVNEQD